MQIFSRPVAHGGLTRGQAAGSTPGMGPGRFGAMFDDVDPNRPQWDDDLLSGLADIMTRALNPDPGRPITEDDDGDENPTIPAGYTYFGQFVDHDITFDPTPLRAKNFDLEALEDFRTPALDLDCVYGSGPDVQPYLYVKESRNGSVRTKLRLGRDLTSTGGTGRAVNLHDVFRLPPEANGQAIAILGDKRNDENQLVAQFQATMIQLHNRVIDDDALLSKFGSPDLSDEVDRFRAAVTCVRWHYQWVVLNDLVRRITAPGTIEEVLNPGGMPRLQRYLGTKPGGPQFAYIPVEFSAAAYRMGHSMIRPSYALNDGVGTGAPFPNRVPIFKPFGQPSEALNGFGKLFPANWGLDMAFFLPLQPSAAASTGQFKLPQASYRMDANLVDPLAALPEFEGLLADPQKKREANLAFRNLVRAKLLRLPSGESIAKALLGKAMSFDELWWAGSRDHGVPIADADLKAIADRRKAFGQSHRAAIEGRTPLWYYILREAERFGNMRDPTDIFGGQHLGPVGSRIVVETFVGLLWMDQTSFLHAPAGFKPAIPSLPRPSSGNALSPFDLTDLVAYALGAPNQKRV
jgi:hypothetical protein